MQERLQKIIARAGVASRRAAEEIITSGRVRVNGRVITELGTKADPREDRVEIDGKRITAPAPVYVALHKPRNVVSTLSDPEGRPSVAELLKSVGTRVFPVGRLDFATSGVLLATNDGEFSQGLLHPKKGVPKTYVLKVMGRMEPDDLDHWRRGVELEDGRTQPAEVRFLRHEEDKTWFEITILEGRNQQLRRMGEATGFAVMRLARVAFAGVTHEGIRPGQWRFLTAAELQDLRKEFGVPKRVRSAESAGKSAQPFGKVMPRGEARPERRRGPGKPAPEHRAHSELPQGRRAQGKPAADRRPHGEPPQERRSQGKPAADRRPHGEPPQERRSQGKPAADRRPHAEPPQERPGGFRSARSGRSGTRPRGAG